MKPVTVGVIGAGRIGKLHIECIFRSLGARLKMVVDPYLDETWAKNLSLNTARHTNAIFSEDEIEGVLICSPSPFHAEQIIGIIGRIYFIKITSRDPAPPSIEYVNASGGIFLDMTIHDFDMIRYLSGSEVEEVYAAGTVLVDSAIGEAGDVDTAITTMKLKDGALAVIDNSRQAVYGCDQRVEVFGSKGSIAAMNNTPTQTVLTTSEGVMSDRPLDFFMERY